jgi:hypothetical protein
VDVIDDAWDVLERAGVPYGTSARAATFADPPRIARAVHAVLAHPDALDERQRVSLLAWLAAWSSAFPTSFGAAFGEEGASVLARARDSVTDTGRYLKLRRLAREKLLGAL